MRVHRTPIHIEPVAGIDRLQQIGFPAIATKNTTRVAGSDPVADAAGVAGSTALQRDTPQ